MRRIGMVQFMNIGVLFLFTDFTMGKSTDAGGIPIFTGAHRDFDNKWFKTTGVKIMMAMLSNSIAPHIKLIVEPLV